MERLQSVLGQKTGDLVTFLGTQPGFTSDRAERFVVVAGRDLIRSYAWQSSEFDHDHPATLANVQILLGAIHAQEIASRLGIPTSDVWSGLRAFVPRVLELADNDGAA